MSGWQKIFTPADRAKSLERRQNHALPEDPPTESWAGTVRHCVLERALFEQKFKYVGEGLPPLRPARRGSRGQP